MVCVHPAQRCTSPLGVMPVGLGGVGHCHDVAELFSRVNFGDLYSAGYVGGKVGAQTHATMMHIRWAPLSGHCWGKAG